jgi:hypothetical protein
MQLIDSCSLPNLPLTLVCSRPAGRNIHSKWSRKRRSPCVPTLIHHWQDEILPNLPLTHLSLTGRNIHSNAREKGDPPASRCYGTGTHTHTHTVSGRILYIYTTIFTTSGYFLLYFLLYFPLQVDAAIATGVCVCVFRWQWVRVSCILVSECLGFLHMSLSLFLCDASESVSCIILCLEFVLHCLPLFRHLLVSTSLTQTSDPLLVPTSTSPSLVSTLPWDCTLLRRFSHPKTSLSLTPRPHFRHFLPPPSPSATPARVRI